MSSIIFSNARISYQNSWCIALIDKVIVDYYYSMIPKWYNKKRQKYDPHITVCRLFEFEGINKEKWLYRNNEIICFYYSPIIQFVSPYFYMNCWSYAISDIRIKLGLPKYRLNYNSYHFSIGNIKISNKE